MEEKLLTFPHLPHQFGLETSRGKSDRLSRILDTAGGPAHVNGNKQADYISIYGSNEMGGELLSTVDFEVFQKTLATAISSAVT
ncbi:hypothetical protein [Nitrosomonas sp. Nm166]|uniref:hypothetical protein n=1 Tax=Nitrosomonas sp. Nm166 TaxID=1881054 RepID=UPI0008E16D71|nr:hypothetical protein [Nitrosomonas sp. Nm166]SFF25636.1 hypothetical protein SAMN05428977_10891 [Nitrosomonas sp. Nm166]